MLLRSPPVPTFNSAILSFHLFFVNTCGGGEMLMNNSKTGA